MKYLLVVVFQLGGPAPQFIDGFLPMQFETYEECEARRVQALENFRKNPNFPPFILSCYKAVKPGSNT